MSARSLPRNDDALSRYQSLLAVTEAISSHVNIPALLKARPDHLQPIVDFDQIAVVLYDTGQKIMRLDATETTLQIHEKPFAAEDGPANTSSEDMVWQTQEPLLTTAVATALLTSSSRRLRSRSLAAL